MIASFYGQTMRQCWTFLTLELLLPFITEESHQIKLSELADFQILVTSETFCI